jgi:putative N-acetylmannosamine-6-phosphate epimerase
VKGKAAVELPVLTVIGKVLPSPLVNVIVLDDIDAVVNKDPVLVAIDGAQDAETANDELNTELEPCGPYILDAVTKLAVVAIDELITEFAP